MDIIIPNKSVEQEDEHNVKMNELKGWTDTGMDELIGKQLNYEEFIYKN